MLLNIRGARGEHNIDGLPVDVNATVRELRRLVAERLNVDDPSRVRLVYSGRLLDDAQPVSFYNIQDGRAVHVVVSAPGANGHTSTSTNPSTSIPTPSVPGMPQMGAAVFSSIGPLFSTMQQAVQSQPAGAALASLLGNAMQQAQQPSVLGVPVASGFPSSSPSATGATPATGAASVPLAGAATPPAGFPQATVATDTATSAPPSASPTASPGGVHGTTSSSPAAGITMTTTTLTGVPRPAMPPLAGVYVHVHCNLSELDQIPARLQQLQQRMTIPNVVFETHTMSSPSATSTPAPTGGPTTVAYQRSHNNARTPSATGTREESLTRWFGAIPRDVSQTPLLLPSILAATAERMGASAVPMLMSGNWTPIVAQRDFMESELLAYLRRYAPAGLGLGDLLTREAWRMYEYIWGQGAIRQLIAAEQRPEMSRVVADTGRTLLQSEFLSFLWCVHQRLVELMHTAQAGLCDAVWSAQLRASLIRLVGTAFHRSSRWFTEGSPALMRVLVQSVDALLSQSSTSGAASAQAAMLAPLLRMALPPLLRSWVSEYEQSGVRSDADDGAFGFTYFSEVNSGEAPPAPATAEADLLDEALNEAQHAAHQHASADPTPTRMDARTEVERLEEAIAEWAEAAQAPADVVNTLSRLTEPTPRTSSMSQQP